MNRLLPVIAILASSHGLCAQQGVQLTLPVRGNVSGQELAVVFDHSPLQSSTITRKSPGLPGNLSPYVNTTPDFSVSALEAAFGALGFDVSLQIDAISSGNDLLPIEDNLTTFGGLDTWVIEPIGQNGPDTWASLSVSVRAGTNVPASSYLDQFPASNNLPAGTYGSQILGYYFEGSLLPNDLQNRAFLEQGILDFTINNQQAPTDLDVRALDSGIPAIYANRGQPQPGVINCVDRLYFSVTNACAQAIEAIEVSMPGQQITRPSTTVTPRITGATIFLADYSQGLPEISVHLEFTDVVPPNTGQGQEPVDAELDALGVAHHSPPPADPKHYLLSFAGMEFGEQIQILKQPSTSSQRVHAPLRTRSGQTVQSILDISPDSDIDAACPQDPETALALPATFGSPIADSVMTPRMGLSLHIERPAEPADTPYIHATVSGWGLATVAPSWVVLIMDPMAGDPTPYIVPTLRQPNQDTFSFSFQAPNVLDGIVDFAVVQSPDNNLSEQNWSWFLRAKSQ